MELIRRWGGEFECRQRKLKFVRLFVGEIDRAGDLSQSLALAAAWASTLNNGDASETDSLIGKLVQSPVKWVLQDSWESLHTPHLLPWNAKYLLQLVWRNKFTPVRGSQYAAVPSAPSALSLATDAADGAEDAATNRMLFRRYYFALFATVTHNTDWATEGKQKEPTKRKSRVPRDRDAELKATRRTWEDIMVGNWITQTRDILHIRKFSRQ